MKKLQNINPIVWKSLAVVAVLGIGLGAYKALAKKSTENSDDTEVLEQ